MAADYAALGVPVHLFEWGWLPVSYKGCAVPERDQDARCEAMRPRIPEFKALAKEADILLFNGILLSVWPRSPRISPKC